ncbi:hypothetical protein [Pedobacter sp. NJ-S-72]
MINNKLITFFIFFTLIISKAQGQSELLPLGHDLNNKLGRDIYFNSSKSSHSDILPYIVSDIDTLGKDSLLKRVMPLQQDWQSKNWIFRKIFSRAFDRSK